MHPEEIKAALRMRGVTQVTLAARLGVDKSTVSNVIAGAGTSGRIKEEIARVIGEKVSSIWPDHGARSRKSQSKKLAREKS